MAGGKASNVHPQEPRCVLRLVPRREPVPSLDTREASGLGVPRNDAGNPGGSEKTKARNQRGRHARQPVPTAPDTTPRTFSPTHLPPPPSPAPSLPPPPPPSPDSPPSRA